MQVKSVEVSRLFSIGNFENIKFGMSAELNSSEPAQEAMVSLAMDLQHTFEAWRDEKERKRHWISARPSTATAACTQNDDDGDGDEMPF